MRSRSLALAVAGAFLLSACDRQPSPARGGAKPPSPFIDDQSLKRLPAIDLRDASGDEVGVSMNGALVLGDGRIAVIDKYSYRLHVFDADGALLGSGAGKGNGPGELQYAAIAPAGGDSIAVLDVNTRRLSIYTSEPRFVRIERLDAIAFPGELLGRFSDGRFVTLDEAMPFSPSGPTDTLRNRVVRVGVDATSRTLVLPQSATLNFRIDASTVSSAGIPVTAERWIAACERGLAVSIDSTVFVYDTSLKEIARAPNQPFGRRLSGPALDEEITRRLGGFRGREVSPAVFERLRKLHGDAVQEYEQPWIDADGHLWRRRYGKQKEVGVYLRTQIDGRVIDTILVANGWREHADGRSFVAFKLGGESLEELLVQPLPAKPTGVTSSLGRCGRPSRY